MKKYSRLGWIGAVGAVLSLAGCSASYKRFDPTTAQSDEGVFIGRVKIVNNGDDITSGCYVGFTSDNKPWVKLDKSGLVFDKTASGRVTLNRVVCQDFSLYHYNPEGAEFNNLGGGATTYFGEVTLNWNFNGGMKATALLGGIGAGIEAASTSNDGTLKMAVTDNGAATAGDLRKIASESNFPGPVVKKSLISIGH